MVAFHTLTLDLLFLSRENIHIHFSPSSTAARLPSLGTGTGTAKVPLNSTGHTRGMSPSG